MSALDAAHARGLVHRDIKPENIFLRDHPDYPDFVKLLDFGIAKLTTGSQSVVGHQTKTGAVLGTPAYMSPEQCLGEGNIDLRSDVYSLGVVLYQMVTGQVPFDGDSLGRLIVCHVQEPPLPPLSVNPGISRALNDVVLRALQKRPQDRFASMKEMREALDLAVGAVAARRVPTPIFGLRPPGAGNATLFPHAAPQENATAMLRPPPRGGVRAGGAPVAEIRQEGSSRAIVSDSTDRMKGLVLARLQEDQFPLPALPPATVDCIERAETGKLTFPEAALILGQVPWLRSRIMKLANSAAFPSLMPATTLELAIARLGLQGLVEALLEIAVREILDGRTPRVREAMRRMWPHSLGVAMLANETCQALGRPQDGHHAHLAGLFVQVGRPLTGSFLLEAEQQLQRQGERVVMTDPLWFGIIEMTYRPCTRALLREWRLPDAFADAVTATAYEPSEGRSLRNIIRFAEALCHRLGVTFPGRNPTDVERTFQEGRSVLGIDDRSLRQLGHSFRERVTVMAGIRG
jgi:HD-like signal output (HDOD) protein